MASKDTTSASIRQGASAHEPTQTTTRDAIMETIAARQTSYAPAWRLREDHSEPGSVLALLFADMQTRIRRGCARSQDKLQRELYTMMGASLRPSLPSRGYVCFDHVDGTDGVLVPEGTELTSTRVNENGDTVPVVTSDDVYVCGMRPRAVCMTDGTEDAYHLVEAAEEGIDWNDVRPFAPISTVENAQRHILHLYHPFCLEGSAACKLALSCADEDSSSLLRRCTFFYDAEDGAVPFEVAEGAAGSLVLSRPNDAPEPVKTVFKGRELYRISVKAPACGQTARLRGLAIGGFSPEQVPEHIFIQGSEVADTQIEPFGKRFSRFDEFTVSAHDALSKRGALVTVRFELSFGIGEVLESEPGIHWKLVMSKDDFPSDTPIPDMKIARVLWEYFNGRTWVALRGAARYAGVFRAPANFAGARPQQVELTFTCPSDIEPSLAEGLSVRARIAEITNEYRTDGRFVYPIISHLRISHRYERSMTPEAADGLQNGCIVADARTTDGYLLSTPLAHRKRCLYLGFDSPIPEGGLQMLAVMRDSKRLRLPRVRYLCDTDRGTEAVACLDRTEGFSKTGLIRLSHVPRQRKTTRFGRELFWICCEDALDAYRDGTIDTPVIEMLYPDATTAETLRLGITERVSVEEGSIAPAFDLMYADVRTARVWVNERNAYSPDDVRALLEAGRARLDSDASRLWVLWEERASLVGCSRDERVYLLDRSSGTLQFGNGLEGKVPEGDIENGVLVEYAVGGGNASRLEVGEVSGLSYARPQISAAYNPLPFYGGLDGERADEALGRMALQAHAAGRTVSHEDLEFAARIVDPHVRAVKCYKGVNVAGEQEAGAVTLVVHSSYGAGDPDAFALFRDRLLESLGGQIGVNAASHVAVCPPNFLRMEVRATIGVADERHAYRVRRELIRSLDAYLASAAHEIGQIPSTDDVARVLMGVDTVVAVSYLAIAYQTASDAKRLELDYKSASKLPFALAVPGTYSFVIEGR